MGDLEGKAGSASMANGTMLINNSLAVNTTVVLPSTIMRWFNNEKKAIVKQSLFCEYNKWARRNTTI